jgi:hypothetical protein
MYNKKFMMGILICFFVVLTNAQGIAGTYFGMYDDNHIAGCAVVKITKSEISIEIADDMYTSMKSGYREQYKLSTNPPFNYLQYGGMQWIFLSWPNGIYIEMKGGNYSFLSTKAEMRTAVLDVGWDIESISYLKENGTNYMAGNLSYMRALPWASGNGYGIGDKINIKLNGHVIPMLIQNGFVSISNPKLYFENSRLKLFTLTSLKTGKSKKVMIGDNPDFQKVEIGDIASSNGTDEVISLQVLEVYKGSKYTDLCINRIIPDFSEQ